MSGPELKRPRPGETLEDLIELEKEFLEARRTRRDVKPAATATVFPFKINSDCESGAQAINNEARSNFESQSVHNETGSDGKDYCFTGLVFEKNVAQSSPGSVDPQDSNMNPRPGPLKTKRERISKFKMERTRLHNSEEQQQPSSSASRNTTVNPDLMKKIQKNFDLFDPFNKTSVNPLKIQETGNNSGKSLNSVVSDTSVGAKIHPLLAGYTEADIVKARDSLLASMKPETREILEKRRLAALAKTENVLTEDHNPQSMEFNQLPEDLQPDKVKHIPHMDVFESEKLEWTKPVKVPEQTESGDKVLLGQVDRAARFSLNGDLITKDPEKNPETWNRGLHHHGEEMERPGYTIEELFTLSRSTFPQQRSLGLNVLSEIFQRSHNGEFDYALDPSIFQACNEIDFIHVLRVTADCQDSMSLNASINCMASLLYPEQEENCLDIAFNWPNADPYPWLDLTNSSPASAVDSNGEQVNGADLKDFQVIKNDLMDFLINRTNLVTRFNYLMNNKMDLLNEPGVQGILKILIRFARHSPNKVMESRDLLHCIQKQFMRPNWSETDNRKTNLAGIPLSKAIKLFRILATSSYKNGKSLYEEFQPFASIMSYLAYGNWRVENVIKNIEDLILESFNLWEAFLCYGIGIQEYTSFFPIMIGFFQTLYRGDKLAPFDLTHMARLHSLLAKILNVLNASENRKSQYAGVKECVGFVASLVVKLLAMLGHENAKELVDHDLCLLALLKGFECLTLAREYETFPKVDSALNKFLQNPTYAKITECLISHSFLLHRTPEPGTISEKEKSKYPSNMISSNAILFGGLQIPILNKGSPFPFMISMLRYAKGMDKGNINFSSIILDCNCKNYLETLSSKKLPVRLNDFLRYELYSIWELISWISSEDRSLQIYVHLVYKLLPHIQEGDEELAKQLLERFMVDSGYSDPTRMFHFYTKFLFIPTMEENPYNFRKLHNKVIPAQWVTEPLNIVYSLKGKDATRSEVQEVARSGVGTVLEFLIFCMQKFRPILIPRVACIPALYTRIVLCFMMGSYIFMDAQIKGHLKVLLELLLSNKSFRIRSNSQKPIFSVYNKMEGFPVTFVSFYSELIAEYSENSYGDDVFGAYIILPLHTSEHASVKSAFWNNECIQFFRTKVEESLVLLEYFTSVAETDLNTLRLYENALISKRVTPERNSLLHAMLDFHVKHAASNLNKS